MSAHPPLALAAATVVACVLLLRWGATPRPRQVRHVRRLDGPASARSGAAPAASESAPTGPGPAPAPASASGSVSASGREPVGGRGALRDAERHLSVHWERLRPLYPHVCDTAAPRHHDRRPTPPRL
ncbi:hypothetical protein ACIA8I_07520 [Streptomyces rishiriensis]|uniref:hypothetical protein n=1 Tax=Streptomyces rishiriensis TaxID=68264 RepID=UPI0037A80025